MKKNLFLPILCLACWQASLAQSLTPEQAGKADDFVDKIGVNTHPPSKYFGSIPSPYADTNTFRTKLVELGVRHIRGDAHPYTYDWEFWKGLYTQHGIKTIPTFYPGSWTIPQMVTNLHNYVSIVDEVEGPNETDC